MRVRFEHLAERLVEEVPAGIEVFGERVVGVACTIRQAATARRVERPRATLRPLAREGLAVRRDGCGPLVATSGLSLRGLAAALAATPHAPPLGAFEAAPDGAATRAEQEALADWCRAATEAALGAGADLESAEATARLLAQHVLVVRPDGQAATRTHHRVEARLHIAAPTGPAAVFAGGVLEAVAPGDVLGPPHELARAALDRARHRAEAVRHTGRMPVVLAAGWGGAWLHEVAGHRLEADAGAFGPADLGRRIGPAGLTIHDDPGHRGGRGTYAFDDEGTPARPTTLVEDGVLRGLLTDGRRAAETGLRRTPNARRAGFHAPPLPRMSNLVLAPGEADPAALIAGVRDGLYVTALGPGHVRPRADRYRIEVVEGYRIERGRLGRPVAGVWLEGSCEAALHDVVAVADDLRLEAARGHCIKAGQAVPVSVAMPTLLLGAAEVVAA